MKSFFITATDTDAGKTLVTAGILRSLSKRGFKTIGFKPVASGCFETPDGLRNDDALQLMEASSLTLDYSSINPFTFKPAIAPHIAAQEHGVKIKLEQIVNIIEQNSDQADYRLIEGVGGWLVPLNEQQTVADLAQELGFPVILVVNMRLGCINHALLTAQAIKQSGLKVAGWIANQSVPDDASMDNLNDNIEALKNRLDMPFIGLLPYLSDAEINSNDFFEYLDLNLI